MEINLTALQRHDSKILKILDTASQVAVYAFNSMTNEWEKTEAEGALFVVARSCEPIHAILILNRLNRDNFVEPITTELDVVENNQYLLYRKGVDKGHIRGIWFYNVTECSKIASLIKNLLESTKLNSKPPLRDAGWPRPTVGGQGDAGWPRPTTDVKRQVLQTSVSESHTPDIVSMLNRAQHQYDQVPSAQKVRPQNSVDPNLTPLTSLLRANSTAPTGLNVQMPNNLGTSDSGNSVPSLLQRLLSAPTGPSTVDASSIQNQRSPMMDVPTIAASSLNRSADMTNTSSSDISRSSIVCPPKNVPPTIPQSNMFMEQHPVLLTPADLSDGCGTSLMTPASELLSLSLSDANSHSPLNEEQFQQAFDYLLKNDANFLTNLHQAYLRSVDCRMHSSSK